MKFNVTSVNKKAFGEGEVVPEAVSDMISGCAAASIDQLRSSWSDEAQDFLEEHLDAALRDATTKVFTALKDAGLYPDFTK